MEEDEEFTRQISLWGPTHQEILRTSSVCLLGSSLIIMEVAKGLMLSGIRNITIVDNTCVTTEDAKYYIFSKGHEILNEYQCKVVRENLMKMNQLANITCIVKNPLNYMNELDSNGDLYDVIVCSLSVKNNLSVEKICRRKGRKIITCNVEGGLGYVHVSGGGHLYVDTCGKKRREKSEWAIYIHLSQCLYDELKEYVRRVDYASLSGCGWRDKIIFLTKCYQDFRLEEADATRDGESIERNSRSHRGGHSYYQSDNRIQCDGPFLTFLGEKLKLKDDPQFPPPDEATYTMLGVRNVMQRIKETLLGNRRERTWQNHIFIFLVVLKSFIKEQKGLPFLLDLKSENPDGGKTISCLDKILVSRKLKDEKQLEELIDKKKQKYKFRKPFTLSHFVYFFWNFLFIRRVESRSNTRDNSLREHFLEFALLYGFGLKPINEGLLSMCRRGGSPPPHYCYYLEQKMKKTRGNLLLCGRHMNLLHFGEGNMNGKIKKELSKRVELSVLHDEGETHIDGYDGAKRLHYLLPYVDANRNIFFNAVREVESTFHRLVCDVRGYGVCVQMVIAGLVTQEAVKMCSLYLEPQSSYFFFTAGKGYGSANIGTAIH
ncbi:ubiquitin-activating enzyme E1, putative [Plasmodium knowlesi strain H]|uniref:Ubiquitin-activating enzyme E1, putative n=3 Tax=Plasmodium knowlesi TaxID=5850 RepID=A0A5K1UT09_PLAKH|nr:ubiquitin-activating enzyme E1, putative [Plasmodium knowlesi strain H]OTN66338.1 putative Ubiquitin-activating enzyme E1 [Plasmodium knowlesi]CAA9989830.1 ubiquitin-activating enzyme E1, putative [Plasmodium knowlesi strain H]SBO24378.1 ubiquitin-activating enzyme E1, putative [Plasmodium knowlesi strain H]SBO26644.1 ubiquitin-activating enzyme E1, putative [Plasmodium knowlesi strain H]VVS79304.1 ubiquitin-activating enzyme E1, putative [Plasmodium knowlesi strain H]|eukprot:XP_002259845.1 hypothetical protein, conserved in Plasmodium species [Plasmodium knowlesi strain H]